MRTTHIAHHEKSLRTVVLIGTIMLYSDVRMFFGIEEIDQVEDNWSFGDAAHTLILVEDFVEKIKDIPEVPVDRIFKDFLMFCADHAVRFIDLEN